MPKKVVPEKVRLSTDEKWAIETSADASGRLVRLDDFRNS